MTPLWLEAVAVERYGPDTAHWIDVYRRFYGFYFSDARDFDPALRLVPPAAQPLILLTIEGAPTRPRVLAHGTSG